ncbi:Fic family protein [Candidatus Collierbacteria bacterium]|nr:Fic family protein [Candidatus Collierbacteria bacterium]
MYQPKYTITNSILKNIGFIEAAREMVENAPLVPHWEAQFRRDAIIRTIHYGTHLEGNQLNREQVEKIVEEIPNTEYRIPNKKTPLDELDDSVFSIQNSELASSGIVARERDIQEVLNYREVLKYIDSQGIPVEAVYGRVKTDFAPYSLETLSEIHRLTTDKVLPENEQGKLRQVQVVIRNKSNGELIFRPPSPAAVPLQLEDFLKWLNSPEGQDHHPVIRAGIAHWELVRIHPFTDGNGRTARAMAMLVLFQEGYDVKQFFSIEQYYDQNPRDYYDALQKAGSEKDGDISAWLEYFTDGLAVELSRVKERVMQLSRDLKLKGKLGRQIPITERQIKILEYMEVNNGYLTTKDTFKMIPMTSRDTIVRDLRYLIDKGVVRKVGRTKASRYVLAE